MFDKRNKIRAASLKSAKPLKSVLSMTCLAIGIMAVIGGLQSAAAEAEPAQGANSAHRCQALTELHLADIEITSAKLVPASAAGPALPTPATKKMIPGAKLEYKLIPVAKPEHCRVEGMINRRKGADGVEYGIGFALALPSNWNGRLMFQGGSAFNGRIGEPYGFIEALGGETALTRGFAVISTDSGHKGEPFDTTFMRDQQAALDFAFNSVPTVTRLGKELAGKYFGRAPHHSYSYGCSTGGREGMIAAQRYPELFDGIIAGDPAMRTWQTRIAAWNAVVAFNRIAPRDTDGKPLPLQAFPAEDQKLLYAAVAKQCDDLDGLKDGLILNLAACKFDPAVIQCEKGKNPSCLSSEQVTALKTAFSGPKDSRGNPVYAGFPYDLGLLGEHVGNPMSLIPGARLNPYGNPPSLFSLDVDSLVRATPLQTLTDTNEWTDLGTFYRKGGKIIFYHGASDPLYSMLDTLDYFQRNKAANPEFDSSRFYSIPGMAHCLGGGPERYDLLSAMVDWVEKGIAPGGIIASDWTRQGGARPLCPWPQYGHYKGIGDLNDAANFECRSD